MRKLAIALTCVAVAVLGGVAWSQSPYEIAFRVGGGVQIVPRAAVPSKVSANGVIWVDSSDSNKAKYTNPAGSTSTIGIGSAGTVTSIDCDTGLTCTPDPIIGTGTIALANTAVVAGSYTATDLTVDAQGRITAAASGAGGGGGDLQDAYDNGETIELASVTPIQLNVPANGDALTFYTPGGAAEIATISLWDQAGGLYINTTGGVDNGINIYPEDGAGGIIGANFYGRGGHGGAGASGGHGTVLGGNGGAGNNAGGWFTGGGGTATGNAAGGAADIYGGANAASGAGGFARLRGGTGATTGGAASATAGAGDVTGGAATLQSGAGGTGAGGALTVLAGSGGTTGGVVGITGGAGTSGVGGSITLTGGASDAGGGSIAINAGAGTPNGSIDLGASNTAAVTITPPLTCSSTALMSGTTTFAGAIAASGAGAKDFSGSSGVFKTSTGAHTFGSAAWGVPANTVVTGAVSATNTTGLSLLSDTADGATSIGVLVKNLTSLANAGARAFSVNNNGTELFSIRPGGDMRMEVNGTGLHSPSNGNGILFYNSILVMEGAGIRPDGAGTQALGGSGFTWAEVASRLYTTDPPATVAVSSNTIAPVRYITHVGAGLIKTITIPTASFNGQIILWPDAAFTYDNTGNILVAAGSGTAVVDRPMIATYDFGISKWAMSY